MPISSTTAQTIPAIVSHRDTICVRRAMVTVVSVNTAAIRIAYTFSRPLVMLRLSAKVPVRAAGMTRPRPR